MVFVEIKVLDHEAGWPSIVRTLYWIAQGHFPAFSNDAPISGMTLSASVQYGPLLFVCQGSVVEHGVNCQYTWCFI